MYASCKIGIHIILAIYIIIQLILICQTNISFPRGIAYYIDCVSINRVSIDTQLYVIQYK